MDLKDRNKVIRQLTFGLIFLQDIKLLYIKKIKSIQLIKKNSYSVKIKLSRKIKWSSIIIFQAILGDDRRRIGITFRDLLHKQHTDPNMHWNRLFNIKRYTDESYIIASTEDITQEIIKRIGKKKNVKI